MKLDFLTLRASTLAAATAFGLAACGGGGYSEPAPAPAPAAAAAETITAALTVDQEGGDIASGAFGSATLTLDRASRTLTAAVTLDGVTPTAAHIHDGAAGTNGAIVFPLGSSMGSGYAISAGNPSLAATVLSVEQLAKLDAGELYVNIHSAENGGGEIRGQIGREVYTARLTGLQETTPVATTATGTGRLVLNPVTRALSGEVEVQGMTGTFAHIHMGAHGSNGGIEITLEDHGGHGHYTVPANTMLTQAQVDALRAGNLYFNVHSDANKGGEIRGQIGRRVFIADATGAQEVPPTSSTATGKGFVTYDWTTRAIKGQLTVTGMTATLAHIHVGAAGTNGAPAVTLTETSPGSGVWTVPTNTTLDADQAKALLSNGMYFNAHSALFGSGEIRGQLIAQ